jgi:hypothetical protein
MIHLLGPRYKLFILFFAFGAGLIFSVGWLTQFHALGNDYWNILYYGRHMTLSQPESLYNGFFPFGYAFLIGQMPFTYVLPLSYAVNALLAGLFVASVSTLVAYADSVPATILAFYLSIAAPFVYQNAITLSPDIGAAGFTAFAVFLLCRDWFDSVPQTSVCDFGKLKFDVRPILAGISLGLSFLWRTHTLVSIVAILAGYFLLSGFRPLRSLALLIVSMAVMAGLQIVVNLISGHGAFETAQAFNLYKFFNGVDWTNPPGPAEIEKFSLIQFIIADPLRAWGLYQPFFYYFLSHAWAAGLAFLLSPNGRYSRLLLLFFIFIVLYAIPISLSDSARSPVVLMVVFLPSVALLLAALIDAAKKVLPNLRFSEWILTALFIGIGFNTFSGWALYDIGITRAAVAERRVLTAIEQTLFDNGMTSPAQIFADRYDFYTPNTMPYRARGIDKWSLDWFWGLAEEYPLLPNDSWETFSAMCREQGIRYLVLGPNSHFRGEIFPPIYNDEVDLDSYGLRFIGQRGKMRLYEFK